MSRLGWFDDLAFEGLLAIGLCAWRPPREFPRGR